MKEIKSEKLTLAKIFDNDVFYTIPNYQRPYKWEVEQVGVLLDDLWSAFENNNSDEYFLGSLVLVNKQNKVYEILDGQQRLTTILLLIATIRDILQDSDFKNDLNNYIYSKGNKVQRIEAKNRISFDLRKEVREFVDEKVINGDVNCLENNDIKDVSINNITVNIECMKKFFEDKKLKISDFISFVMTKSILIKISTESQEDAFRVFSILNDRGLKLSAVDVLKAENIGEINDELKRNDYAKEWEKLENYFLDKDKDQGLDRFISHIRTIYVKEKARKSLLKDFKENIYDKNLLETGEDTFKVVFKYKEILDKLESDDNETDFKNLYHIMDNYIDSDDWLPPLLYFYRKFNKVKLYSFLEKLELKVISDIIVAETPSNRIDNMNKILKAIEKYDTIEDIINDNEIFIINKQNVKNALNGKIYGKKFAKYLLLKYEFKSQDNCSHIKYENALSIEHVLPQNPKIDSEWVAKFAKEEREFWTDNIANLVIINGRKNSGMANSDFNIKQTYLKEKSKLGGDYFKGSNSVFDSDNTWTVKKLQERHSDILKKLGY